MVARITQEEFVTRSTEIHNGKYDYSKTIYVRSSDKVIITCPTHNDFLQRPTEHLKGYGCKKCAMDKLVEKHKLTTEVFIEKAKQVHGDRYDYSETVYTLSCDNIIAYCPKHKEYFNVIANNHLQGQGCQKCGFETIGNKLRISSCDYINKVRLLHGDKYDYTETEYNGRHENVRVFCNIHQVFFSINPHDHLRGNGCKLCGRESASKKKSLTTLDFITRVKSVHGNKYDYTGTEYTVGEKVRVFCNKHTTYFNIDPHNHIQGQGCKLCAREHFLSNIRDTKEEFVAKATRVWGDRFDYVDTVYEHSQVFTSIRCKEHNTIFKIRPTNHLSGQVGCPHCVEYGFKRAKPAQLYVHLISNGVATFVGYGITNYINKRTKQHIKTLRREGFKIVETHIINCIGEHAFQIESMLKQKYSPSSVAGNIEGFKRESADELFSTLVLSAETLFKEKPWQQLT